MYKIEGTINNDTEPCFGNPETYPQFQEELEQFKHHLVELVYFINPKSPQGHLNRNQLGASHICFNVDSISEIYQSLSEKGIKFVTEPKYTTNAEGKKRGVCYAQDPEGNWLEFIGEDQ